MLALQDLLHPSLQKALATAQAHLHPSPQEALATAQALLHPSRPHKAQVGCFVPWMHAWHRLFMPASDQSFTPAEPGAKLQEHNIGKLHRHETMHLVLFVTFMLAWQDLLPPSPQKALGTAQAPLHPSPQKALAIALAHLHPSHPHKAQVGCFVLWMHAWHRLFMPAKV